MMKGTASQIVTKDPFLGLNVLNFFLLESVFIEINAGTSLLIIYMILTAFVNCLPLSKMIHN